HMITTPTRHTNAKTENRPLTTPAPSWMTQDVCFGVSAALRGAVRPYALVRLAAAPLGGCESLRSLARPVAGFPVSSRASAGSRSARTPAFLIRRRQAG